MEYKSFDSLLSALKTKPVSGRLAVAAAGDRHTLEAVFDAQDGGYVSAILVGDAEKIRQIHIEMGRELPPKDSIIDAADPADACAKAVALIREGRADILMKGMVDTKVFLGAVVDKQKGLGTGRLMTHFAIMEVPGYHKLVAPVDSGMVTYPTLEQKREIILNSVGVFHKLGYSCPKVAVLACAEKVNPKMPETVDGDMLKKMNRDGDIPGCIVEGPVSYDCAMSKEIAAVKGFDSPVSGDVDILLAPNIHAGNIMGKMLSVTCHARMAGFITGASCPIIMTSRGASPEEKLFSLALASAITVK